jgi:5-methyltetrahydropteroyltriglutamate--homocysteine methyltransferase
MNDQFALGRDRRRSGVLETMIVGSLPRPAWLASPGEIFATWNLDGHVLAEGQDDAVRLAVEDQHRAGLDILTDGEQRRRHYIWGFVRGLEGIDFGRMEQIVTRGGRYNTTVPAPVVNGPVRRRGPVTVDALGFLRAATDKPVKVTLPGPMTVADSLADEYYGGDRRRLAMEMARLLNEEAHELAEAGCQIVQFDEPCFNVYLDEVEEWGIDALEMAAAHLPVRTAVHVCYGYGVPVVLEWKRQNTDWTHYHHTLPLLQQSAVDQISVECAASGVEPGVLALAKGKDLVVGVIDVGTEEVESPETVAGRIREALVHVEPDRLFPSTDCGLMPRTRRSAQGKMAALAEGAAIVRAELTEGGS